MCFSSDSPPPRDYAAETRDTLKSQIELAPQQYAAQAEFAPQYASLNMGILSDVLNGTNGQPGYLSLFENAIAPNAARVQSAADAAQRLSDVSAVEQLGGRAVTAFRAADPRREALMQSLNDQVLGDFQLGAALDPETRRQLEQQVRAAQAQRGMGLGPADLYAEAMTTGLAGQQLRQQRLSNAFNVANLNSSGLDPFMAILGRPATSTNLAQSQAGAGQGQAGSLQGSLQNLFNPESAYASDLYNTNLNMEAAARLNSQNANAGLWGAGISALGGIAGGAIAGGAIGCWVAREVYGDRNIRWIWFRNWLMFDAPAWFRWCYVTFGERFAAWLHFHPRLKPPIRRWMDARITSYFSHSSHPSHQR